MKRALIIIIMVVSLAIFSGCILSGVTFAYDSVFYKESSWNGLSFNDNLGNSSGCDSNITYNGNRNVSAGDLFNCAWLRTDQGKDGHRDNESEVTVIDGTNHMITEFYIDLNPGRICAIEGNCRQYSRFLCAKGFHYLTVLGKIYIDDISTPPDADENYYYFLVTFEPGYHAHVSNPQTVMGIIKVRKDAIDSNISVNAVEGYYDANGSFVMVDDGTGHARVIESNIASSQVTNGSASLSIPASVNDYTWVQWGGNSCSGQGRVCNLSNLTITEPTVYNAYYAKSFTLQVDAVEGKYNANGNLVMVDDGTGHAKSIRTNVDSDTVFKGQNANLNPPESVDGYTWVQWGSNDCSGQGRDCTISNVTREYSSFNAYYVKGKTLSVNAYEGKYDENGNFVPVRDNNGKVVKIQENIISPVTVANGRSATLDVSGYNPPAGYTWVQWGGGGACAGAGSNQVCTVDSVSEDSVISVYYVKGKTLSVNAYEGKYDENGNFVPVRDNNGKVVKIQENIISPVTVANGRSATLDVSGYNPPAGYTWVQWGGGGACAGAGSNQVCTVSSVSEDEVVSAYYVKNFTLKVNAVEGKYVNGVFVPVYEDDAKTTIRLIRADIISPVTVANGRSASLGAPASVDGYTWVQWGGGGACASAGKNQRCTVSNVSSDKTINAYYVRNESNFDGKIDVSGANGQNMDYTTADIREPYIVENCPITGCTVTFDHYIRRGGGSDTTPYTITRSSNFESKVGSMPQTALARTAGGKVYSDSLTLFPGMKVCETLRFVQNTKQLSSYTTIEACVLVPGTVGSDIEIKAKNESISDNWQTADVYAKPGDRIALKGAYTPRYQYAYAMLPDSVKIDDGATLQGQNENLKSVFDKNKSPGWKNGFSIDVFDGGIRRNLSGSIHAYMRDAGQDTRDEGIVGGDDAYKVSFGDVGKTELEARAETNAFSETETTPKQVTFTEGENQYGYLIDAAVDTGAISESVGVRVPYNFENKTSIDKEENSKVKIPAGGSTDNIKLSYFIGPRANSETTNDSSEYATSVGIAKWKLQYCVGEDCGSDGVKVKNWHKVTGESKEYVDESSEFDISSDSEMYNGKTIKKEAKIDNVPDAEAGTQFCIRSSIYPANSGDYRNYDNPAGSDTWADSEDAVCYRISKQPNFQVWGGNVYSEGNISTPQTVKANVDGYGEGKHVFGSWTELGLIAKGEVKGLASGAGLGYPMGYPMGSNDDDFCKMSTLSFLNNGCVSGMVGGVKNISTSNVDIEGLKNNGWRFYEYDGDGELVNDLEYGYARIRLPDEEEKADRVGWSYTGDYIIDGNITRTKRDGGNNSWNDVGGWIIHARNIKINCNVTRIDAVLIADDNIDTCADEPKINAQGRSYPLTINGAVISNTLTLGRTYGAGKGENSIVPAEIINYDASLYSWASNQPGSADREGLTEAYTSELAPRY